MYLIFDLDDTLLDTSATAGRFKLMEVAQLWNRMGVLRETTDRASQLMIEWRFEEPTGRDVLRRYARHAGLSDEALRAGEQEYYERDHAEVPIRLMHGAIECLEDLRRHYRLALVSIGRSEQQHRKMEAAGLDPARFDHIRIVEQGGKRAAFLDIAHSWGLDLAVGLSSVVVIGDRYATDIAPAKELGMRTVMIGTQKAEIEPDSRIATLEELAPILARWRRERHGNH